MAAIFDYDPALPLDIQETGVEERKGIAVHDLSYAGTMGRRYRAYLVRPPGNGPWAGLIFVHPGLGARTDFLDEALQLAGAGALSLLIEAPWARGQEWPALFAGPQVMQGDFIGIVQDLRRGVDLVLAQPGVDASRTGYVGHSFGALFGGVLAGVERRPSAYVLLSGVGSFTDVALVNIPGLAGEALDEFRRYMDPIDPVHYVGHAAPAALFYQFGLHDNFFSTRQFEQYYQAGSEPKSVQWYEAEHYQVNAAGRADRVAWLTAHLALNKDSNQRGPGA